MEFRSRIQATKDLRKCAIIPFEVRRQLARKNVESLKRQESLETMGGHLRVMIDQEGPLS
jgi:hypothetical protein